MIPIVHYPTVNIAHCRQQNCEQISFQGNLKLLNSQKILFNFEQISKIYRESGHCKEISKYLKKRLSNTGFDVIKKPDGTICASRNINKAKNNAIILQSHMDMVAISADKNPKKPIEMHVKNGWLYANDRTLGADDGLGMAAMLTIAEDARFKKYPLEMIFTTDEETGMFGAQNLKNTDFYGKYLINLDSEKYGTITKGCAGISEFVFKEKIKEIPVENNNFVKMTINITGAKGGHSACVNNNSLNPIKVLISELKDKKINLVELSGGERKNSIPREAQAQILVSKSEEKAIMEIFKSDLEQIKTKNLSQNPDLNFSISCKNAPMGTKYVAPEVQNKLLTALDSLPIGLLSKFEDTGSNKTSQNLGILKIADGEFYTEIMGRSSDLKEGQNLTKTTSKILSDFFNKQISPSSATPIWEPKKRSILEDTVVKAYSDISNGGKPTVQVEHGGLESAIFTQTKPDLEQVSIGPTIEDPHSVQERVKINTVLPFYNWLSKILEFLPKN
jgi:dipeptidase D